MKSEHEKKYIHISKTGLLSVLWFAATLFSILSVAHTYGNNNIPPTLFNFPGFVMIIVNGALAGLFLADHC